MTERVLAEALAGENEAMPDEPLTLKVSTEDQKPVSSRYRALDRVLGHMQIAERLMHRYFGSVGVQSLDDARKAIIDEEFDDE